MPSAASEESHPIIHPIIASKSLPPIDNNSTQVVEKFAAGITTPDADENDDTPGAENDDPASAYAGYRGPWPKDIPEDIDCNTFNCIIISTLKKWLYCYMNCILKKGAEIHKNSKNVGASASTTKDKGSSTTTRAVETSSSLRF